MRPREADVIDPATFSKMPGVAQTVLINPYIQIIPGLLRDEDISHILALCAGRWKHSRVGIVNDDFKKGKESEVRTSSSCTLRRGETPLIREIEQRVSQIAGIDSSYLENLAPVRYMPGQQYRPHHDGSARPVTVFIYLNDLEEDAGGETYFPMLDIKFVPRRGCAVMWRNPLDAKAGGSKDNEDSRLLHAGLPPRKGVKYGLNCFFNCMVQEEAPTSQEYCSSSCSQTQSSNTVPAPQQTPWAAPPPRASPLPSRGLGSGWNSTTGLQTSWTPPSLSIGAPRSGPWPGIVACN